MAEFEARANSGEHRLPLLPQLPPKADAGVYLTLGIPLLALAAARLAGG